MKSLKEMFLHSINLLFLEPRNFYRMGAGCYLVVGICHTIMWINAIRTVEEIYIIGLIASIFQNLFDYLIVSFLLFLYRMQPKKPATDQDMMKLLETGGK